MKDLMLERGVWKIDETEFLGRPGGFGSVHPGRDSRGDPVAIKILFGASSDAAHRELEFAKAVAGRSDQHVIAILDYGVDALSGRSCIVMSRAEGSLRDRMNPGPRFLEGELLDVLLQVARGLVEVGDWVHRDLKPENVLKHAGLWKITDFGIARLADAKTSLRTLKGALSPFYAAPEQWDGRRASHATDVYALGCVGVELLTGSTPFLGPEIEDLAQQHRAAEPVITRGSPRIRSLLYRMLAKPMAARPDTDDVIDVLLQMRQRPRASGPGALSLEEAAVVVAEQTAKSEAAQAADEAKRVERAELTAYGFSVLGGIAEQLFSEIKTSAPEVVLTKVVSKEGYRLYTAALGEGKISMSVGRYNEISPVVFGSSGWEVACGDFIVVENKSYMRSASLWYANLNQNRFRWVEVAYWTQGGDPAKMPCHLPPSIDAGSAMSSTPHTWNLAYPPRPVANDAEIDDFCQRWIRFFSESIQGTLKYPGQMPEDRFDNVKDHHGIDRSMR